MGSMEEVGERFVDDGGMVAPLLLPVLRLMLEEAVVGLLVRTGCTVVPDG